MRARILVVWALAGCAFDPRHRPSDEVPLVDADTDAPEDSTVVDIDGAIDAPLVNPCDVPSPVGLVACYQLDDNFGGGVFVDGSGHGHDAAGSGLTAITRTVGTTSSQAASITSATSVFAPQDAAFELKTAFTLSAWVMPINPNPADNEGVIDHENQYAMSILNGKLSCWPPNSPIVDTTAITNNEWQLIACTWTPSNLCVTRIRATGGIDQTCNSVGGSIANGKNGISIGSFQTGSGVAEQQFNGAIDDVRLYARVLSNQELCTLAGRTSCP